MTVSAGRKAITAPAWGGLEDLVAALDGRLAVESPPGGPTRVCALLPLPDPG